LHFGVYESTVRSLNYCPTRFQSVIGSQFAQRRKETQTFGYYAFLRPSCKAGEDERSKPRDLTHYYYLWRTSDNAYAESGSSGSIETWFAVLGTNRSSKDLN
jgi:hypothetical protein